MRRWRASSPRSRRSTSTTPASAPARRHGRRCSSTSKCSTTGSGYTRASATAPRPRRAPTWKGSACVRPRDVLIPPLHSPGAGPGEDDPAKLVALAHPRLSATPERLREALRGRVTAHHRFLLRLHLDQVDALEAAGGRIDREVEAHLAPFRAAVELLASIPGVGALAAR